MTKNIRESNFELLRIILIGMVLVLHFQNVFVSDFDELKGGYKFAFELLRSFCICAVDCFIILSGYFLCENNKIQIRKIINLFVYVLLFNVCLYIINYFIYDKYEKGGVKNLIINLLPRNYYLWLYCTVYILHPLLNFGKNECKKIAVILLILFSVIPTLEDTVFKDVSDMSPVARTGNGDGYTAINFILLYYVGMFLRTIKVDRKTSVGMFCLCVLLITGNWLFIAKHSAHNYCNILVIFAATSLFCFVREFSFKSRIINFLSKSVWGIYIWNGFILCILNKLYLQKYGDYNFDSFISVIVLFGTVILSFFIGIIIDIVFRLFIKLIDILIDKIKLCNLTFSI